MIFPAPNQWKCYSTIVIGVFLCLDMSTATLTHFAVTNTSLSQPHTRARQIINSRSLRPSSGISVRHQTESDFKSNVRPDSTKHRRRLNAAAPKSTAVLNFAHVMMIFLSVGLVVLLSMHRLSRKSSSRRGSLCEQDQSTAVEFGPQSLHEATSNYYKHILPGEIVETLRSGVNDSRSAFANTELQCSLGSACGDTYDLFGERSGKRERKAHNSHLPARTMEESPWVGDCVRTLKMRMEVPAQQGNLNLFDVETLPPGFMRV
eukprot:m.3981 g.3981  ORF g.3981 m.3981 type:complete len:262 (+) comp2958_c0_seq1:124-909(+)